MTEMHKDILEQAAEALAETTVPQGPPQALVQKTLEQIKIRQSTRLQGQRVRQRINFMRSLPKLAAAAIIILGVWIGLSLISPDHNGLVLAEVLHRIRTVPAFTYRIQMTTSGQPFAEGMPSPQNMNGTIWVSNQTNAIKMEMLQEGKVLQTMYLLPEEKRMVTLMPESKAYMQFTLSDDLLKEYRQNQGDPREMIGRVIDSNYTNLGDAVVNGVKCQVIESDDPRLAGGVFEQVRAKLWIDDETGYPIQWEMNVTANEGKTEMHMLVYDFRWDTTLEPGEFTPVIPEGYTSMGTIKIPAMDETTALNGFRKYVELTGKYPKTLSSLEIIKEVIPALALTHPEWKELAQEQDNELSGPQQQFVQKLMDEMMPIQALAMFYARLVQADKDPAYNGQQVTPGSSGQILLRWKLDDNTYKVIYGDLTTTEMSFEQLQQIEPAPESAPETGTP